MSPQPAPRRHRLIWPLLATALVISWSSGFVGTRFAADQAPVFQMLFWRVLVSGVLLLPLALWAGPWPRGRELALQMLYGVMGMFLYLGGFGIAMAQGVPTGLVALIADLVPLAIAALSQPLLGQALSRRQWLGTGIGAAGVALVSADSLSLGAAPLLAYALPVIGMLLFALIAVLQKRLGSIHLPISQSLTIQCLTASACFAACAVWTGEGLSPPLTARFVFGIGWLVLFSTFFCYSVYYLCLRLYPAAQVASVIYLSPPVTLIWAALMFHEPMTAAMFAGLAITFLGVWLTTAPRQNAQHSAS